LDSGLEVGDEIISVNNNSLENSTHKNAIYYLKNSGTEVEINIKRNIIIPKVYFNYYYFNNNNYY